MKVLHVTTGFSLTYPGGIPNYVRSLAKSQIQLGHEVHALARPGAEFPAELSRVILHPYLPSDVVPFSLRNYDTDSAELSIISLMQNERFDLVHFHMALDISTGFLKRFVDLKIPYIVSLHDYHYICPRITMIDYSSHVCRKVEISKCNTCIGKLDQIDVLRRGAKKLGVLLPRIPSTAAEKRMDSMRKFLENSNLLLSVSTRTAEIYSEVVPEARIAVEQIGNDSIDAVVAKSTSDRIRVVALGTLSKHKGADLLRALLARVRREDMEFHFYGRAIEGYGNKLARLGLICHGPYKPSEVSAIMSNSDIGLVLSIWEDNGPQVAMEFINHKVPVLGTQRGGIPDIVAANAGYLFDPDDSGGIDGAVSWLQSISLNDIGAISANMKKLKSPLEHARRVDALYAQALNSSLAGGT